MAAKRKMPVGPMGGKKTIKSAVLAKGSDILQSHAPLNDFDIYVVGFHPSKDNPQRQMEAHHYCKQVNEDFLQCVLFDGNTEEANLIGIEYIISEPLFLSLPQEERKFWHPHNFEILSGQLVAPGLPDAAETSMLELLMNSYGKTWHLWHTGRHDGKGEPGLPLPMGEAMLMWSFNRFGEADTDLEKDRNEAMGIDPSEKREQRKDLVDLAKPQWGVDAIKDKFANAEPNPPPGVIDIENA